MLLAFVCTVLLLVFPIFNVTASSMGQTVTAEFGAYGLSGPDFKGTFPIYLVFITLSLLSAAAILMYKKRPRQLLIVRLNLIVHVMVTIGIFLFYYMGKGIVASKIGRDVSATVEFSYGAGFFLLVPPLAFLLLAIRGIKHDENLVRSLDRLR